MTKRNDFLTDLEDYLVDFDGETPLPERVRDALDAELATTHQVRPVTGRWKGHNMSSTTPKIARWGLVAAVLVVAVGLGAAIMLPGRGLGVGAPVASPTPAPTPTPSPSTASTLKTLAGAPHDSCHAMSTAGCIVPGTYLLGSAVPGGTIDVPAGWWEWNPGVGSVGLLVEHADVPAGSGWGLTIMQVGDVRRDPCDRAAGTFAPADVDTPAELAAATATWPGFEATSPAPVQVGGIEGVQVRLTSTRSPVDCVGAVLWETPSGTPIEGYPMVNADVDGYPADFAIIDRNGQLLVVRAMAGAGTSPFEREQGIAVDPIRHEADLVAQQAIIDSIRFGDAGQ
jgi:hypothetical protein